MTGKYMKSDEVVTTNIDPTMHVPTQLGSDGPFLLPRGIFGSFAGKINR